MTLMMVRMVRAGWGPPVPMCHPCLPHPKLTLSPIPSHFQLCLRPNFSLSLSGWGPPSWGSGQEVCGRGRVEWG